MESSDTRERLEREARYHDEVVAAGGARRADKFYEIADEAWRHYYELTLTGCTASTVLEYGCGPGSLAFDLAERGARVFGIDISPAAIETAAQEARERGVAEAIDFRVGNAEDLPFHDQQFDLVCGTGILHHLDLDHAYPEIARVLRPGGRAIFLEPLGHNRAINWYRDRTPDLRTPDEHPLLREDLEHARRCFDRVDLSYFNLAVLAAVPLRSTPLFGAAIGALSLVDRLLLNRLSPLRLQAWMVLMSMERR